MFSKYHSLSNVGHTLFNANLRYDRSGEPSDYHDEYVCNKKSDHPLK